MYNLNNREKITALMRALTFYTPESMVNSLRDVKVKNLILERSEKCGSHFVVDGRVTANIEPLQIERTISNNLVFLRNSNDLEFIFNLYQIYCSGLFPVLISPLTTDTEINELKKRFVPAGFYDSGSFNSESISNPSNLIQDDDAVIILTSGSSGRPKAVVHTFSSLINAAARGNSELNIDAKQDKWLLSLPLHHISGFSILFRSMLASTPLVLSKTLNPSDKDFFDVKEFNPMLVSFVPSQLRDFLDSENSGLLNFRHILIGGSAVDAKLINRSLEAKLQISKVYGSSETAAFIAITDYKTLSEDIEAGARPLNGVDISVVDGELIIKTDQLFNRYFDDEALTLANTGEGGFKTGDLVQIDSQGRIKITGRKSRFIISGGLNVDPEEVERVIRTFPGIEDVFVFSVVNEKWGEAVSALLKTGYEIDFQDFHSYLKTHLLVYKIPKYYRIVDDIPKTAIGKNDLEESRRLLFER
jgi:O-succinylbenzoic acid--CoA ligase